MKRVTLTLALVFLSVPGFLSAQQQPLAVTITTPQSNATVAQRHTISGAVSDRQAKVWVVIHPLGTNTFWVQPPVTLNPDGTWNVLAYFGREGGLDEGNQYEIRAFVNPREPLQSGERSSWPPAAAQSQGLKVTRE